MRGLLAMALLVVGLVLASSSASRLGADHAAYQEALVQAEAGADDATREAAAATLDAGLPSPGERVSQWASVGGIGWVLGLVLIVAGAVLARRDQADKAAGIGMSEADKVDFLGVLDAMDTVARDGLATLAEVADDADMPAVRDALDALRLEVLGPMVDGRGQLVARHGMSDFAEYFGAFSGAERQLNRAWSALTDAHVPTAREALAASQGSVVLAREAWHSAEARRDARAG